MSSPYRIFGAENSPFSVKTRAYFRYKGIPHDWVIRNASTQAEFNQRAKLPLIPLVLTPDGDAIQDSNDLAAIEFLVERRVLVGSVTHTGRDRDAAATADVERGKIFGEAQRIVERCEQCRDRHQYISRSTDDHPRHRQRRRQESIFHAVVFGESNGHKAPFVRPPAHVQRCRVQFAATGFPKAWSPHIETNGRNRHLAPGCG